MGLELYRRIGKGTVTSLTANFLSLTAEIPLEAIDFEVISDEGFHLMFPPQLVSSGGLNAREEYLYNFKRVPPCQ